MPNLDTAINVSAHLPSRLALANLCRITEEEDHTRSRDGCEEGSKEGRGKTGAEEKKREEKRVTADE